MNLKEVGDLANLLAAIGVIISLLFVGYEIRQNTEGTRAASAAEVGDNLRELILARAQSPSLAAAVSAARSGEEMTQVQEAQYNAYVIALTRTVEDAYIQYRAGRLEEDQMQARLAALSLYVSDQERRDQLTRSEVFSEAFRQWLDEQYAASE